MPKIYLDSEFQKLHKIFSAVRKSNEVKPHNSHNVEQILKLFQRNNKVLYDSYGLQDKVQLISNSSSTEQFLSTVSNIIDVFRKAQLIDSIEPSISLTKRKQICEIVWPIIKNDLHKESQKLVIQAFSRLDDLTRLEFVKLFNGRLAHVQKDIHKVIPCLATISNSLRVSLFTTYAGLFEHVTQGDTLVRIITAIHDIPYRCKEAVLSFAIGYIQEMRIDVASRADIIRIASRSTMIDFPKIMEITRSFFVYITDSEDQKKILEKVVIESNAKRLHLLFALKPLFKHVNVYQDVDDLISFIKDLPIESLESIVALFSSIDHFECVRDLLEYMEYFLRKDKELRGSLFSRIAPLFTYEMEIDRKTHIFDALDDFPDESLLEAASEVVNILDELTYIESRFDLHSILLDSAPALVAPLHAGLINQLSEETDQMRARRLAKKIFDFRDFLHADDDSTLVTQALSVMTVAFSQRDRKNPYEIFRKHVNISKKIINVRMPISSLFSELYTINAEKLKTRHSRFISKEAVITLCRGQVLTAHDLTSMVDNMKLRISQLDPSTREGVYQYVRESIESDGQGMQGGDSNKAFNDLCQNITDSFFIDLLNRPHGDEVVFTKAYFISILRFLLDLAQDVQAGAFLSIQEETLLKMSESIKNCSVGKKESITLAYKTIPKEYRYENETEDLPVAVKALEFIENSISSYILHLFTSEDPFLYDIQGSREKLSQLSHHSLYLKNRMAAFVGLNHEIQFDLHTEVLKNEFINKDIHTLLQIFYRHFTVESLVSLMQKIYSEAPGSACLFEGFSQILEPLNATDIWIVDEDPPYKVSLSKNGALQLLLECGYVKKYAKRARKS